MIFWPQAVNEESLKQLNEYLETIRIRQRVIPQTLLFYLRDTTPVTVTTTPSKHGTNKDRYKHRDMQKKVMFCMGKQTSVRDVSKICSEIWDTLTGACSIVHIACVCVCKCESVYYSRNREHNETYCTL